jgi:hypothetical protein
MAQINTTENFQDGELVTGQRLNNIIGRAEALSGLITEQPANSLTGNAASAAQDINQQFPRGSVFDTSPPTSTAGGYSHLDRIVYHKADQPSGIKQTTLGGLFKCGLEAWHDIIYTTTILPSTPEPQGVMTIGNFAWTQTDGVDDIYSTSPNIQIHGNTAIDGWCRTTQLLVENDSFFENDLDVKGDLLVVGDSLCAGNAHFRANISIGWFNETPEVAFLFTNAFSVNFQSYSGYGGVPSNSSTIQNDWRVLLDSSNSSIPLKRGQQREYWEIDFATEIFCTNPSNVSWSLGRSTFGGGFTLYEGGRFSTSAPNQCVPIRARTLIGPSTIEQGNIELRVFFNATGSNAKVIAAPDSSEVGSIYGQLGFAGSGGIKKGATVKCFKRN